MTESTPKPSSPPPLKSLVIRPWPKVVFLYPTFIVSTVFWLLSLLNTDSTDATMSTVGNIWMIVFALNLLVFSFDFSRIKSITIVVTIIAVVLGIGWANSNWGWFTGIKELLGQIDNRMNTQFFGFISFFLATCLALVFINTRFNYYEINHREVLHHHGYLGDITRTPTAGMHVNKEINDLLEFVLLRSGRLVFHPAGAHMPVVIDNVMNVNRVEEHIKDLLSVVAVRMQTPVMEQIQEH